MINPWLQFAVCAVIIVIAGSRLTRMAAIVAHNTGIGTAWIGALMLPLATSLPELVTTLRAVTIDAPDLALGNIFGSCLYNLTLIAVIDLLEGRGPLTARINRGHIIMASMSIITVSFAVVAMLGVINLTISRVSFETVIIALIYIMGSRLLYRYEKRQVSIDLEEAGFRSSRSGQSTGMALFQFLIAAAFIVGAGVFLTDASDKIAVSTGLGHTFVGSIFLAISTSLPETVTTITAVRIGLLDMAVANVFGANFMNLFIVFIADLFYRGGPLLYAVSDNNLFSAIMVIMLSTFVIFGITYRSERKFARIGVDALLVLLGYLVAVYMLYILGGN
ncbi:MAG: sodium:calcium antiporter [Firmicutes bacterium]|nr:sodium:calcium antiporter [Bacillota bacterium]